MLCSWMLSFQQITALCLILCLLKIVAFLWIAVGALLTCYPAAHQLSLWRGVGQMMQLDRSFIYSIRGVCFVLSSDWSFSLCVLYELLDGNLVESWCELWAVEILLHCVLTNEARHPATNAFLDVFRGEYEAVLKICNISDSRRNSSHSERKLPLKHQCPANPIWHDFTFSEILTVKLYLQVPR